MSCLGNNLDSVIKQIDSDIQNIIKNQNIKIEENGEISFSSIEDLEKAQKDVEEYLSSYFPSSLTIPTLFIKENEIIKYSFPSELKVSLEEKIKIDKKENEIIEQASSQISSEQEVIDFLAQNPSYLDEINNTSFSFDPTISLDPEVDLSDFQQEYVEPEMSFDFSQNTKDVENGTASYQQYTIYKKDLLKKIKNTLQHYTRVNRKEAGTPHYIEMVKRLNRNIEMLSIDIEKLDTNKNNLEVIYQDVINEVEYLSSILDNISIDSIQVTDLLNRLENLNKFFHNKDLNNKTVGEEYRDSNLFWVKREEYTGYDTIAGKIERLIDKWHISQRELIKNIMENNSITQQHIKEGRLKYTEENGKELTQEETIAKINQYIDNPDDTNFFISRLFGAGIGGDIFGQILKIEKDVALVSRQGETGSIMQKIDILYDTLKGKAEKGKNIFEDYIQKDSLGVKTNRLISKFSGEWFKYVSKRNKLYKVYNEGGQDLTAKSLNYEQFMRLKKSNEDVLDISKLKYFKDKYNSEEFSQYFTFSDMEMEKYEQEVIKTLGLNFFNALIKEQENKLKEWIETVAKDDLASNKFKFETNPFEFVKHYYSENFYKQNNNAFMNFKYTSSFPLENTRESNKSLNYFNEDFKQIEKDVDKFEFWNSVNTLLTEYINTELIANGENISLYELPMLQDLLANEIIKNASLGQKGLLWSKELWNSWSKMFASSAYANLDKDTTKLGTGYSNTISRRAKELESLLKTNSIEELSKIANEEGISYDIDKEYVQKLQGIENSKSSSESKIKQKDYIRKQEKNRLAKAIANKRTFSPTDEDFITILRSLKSITDSLSARQSSLNVARILENYVNSKIAKNGQPLLKNTSNWFDAYIKRNIYQDTVHGDREKDNEGNLKASGKFFGKKLKFLNFNKGIQKLFSTTDFDVPALDWSKFMSTEDKEFYNFLKDEIKEVKEKEDFEFSIEDTKFYNKEGEYYQQKEGTPESKIKREEIEQKYVEYLGKRAESLGIDRTIGSLLNGFLSVFVQKALALNPKSGYRNLWEGGTKNMQIAASGRYDFGMEELQYAKDFLWGINTDRYLETFSGDKMLSINRMSKDHALNIRTYKRMINQFGLVQDRKNESARAEDFDSKKRKFKFGLMDFAVENPEAHNQGELILSQLQKVNIDYINENGEVKKRPVFDGEKGDFIWIPGTLTLKDEYRTKDNIRMWENFLESKGEENKSLSTIVGIHALIERTQGNYSDGDIVAIQGSTLGRLLMTFKRFYPEHFWQNYGEQKFDLIRGETNFKGRKRIMLENAPVTAAYLSAIGALSVTGGIGLFFGGGLLLSFLTQYGINRFVNKNKIKMNMDANSLKQSLNFTLEMLTRSIDRPLEMYLRGKTPLGKYWLTHTVMGKTQSLNSEVLTEKERKLLSENAQEIAQRVNLVLNSALIITVMKALVALISGDDDDEYKENLKKIEGTMNLVLNTANTLNSQLNEMNNPVTFVNNVSKISLFGTLEDASKSIDIIKKVINEEKDVSSAVSPVMRSMLNPVPVPNMLVNQFFKEGTGFFEDAQVYNKAWWNGMKDDSAKTLKRKIKVQRANLRDEIEDYYYNKFDEEYPDKSTSVKRAKAKEAAKKEIIKNYSKMNYESDDEILNRINFKEEEKIWSEGKADSEFEWSDLEE